MLANEMAFHLFTLADALVMGDRDRLLLRRVNQREWNSAMFAID
jgi:hypothetical protein